MALRFCPLYSGSSGNCTFISDGKTGIIIDAGLSGKRIEAALAQIDFLPEALSGILITHEHTDHVKGAGILSRKYHLPIYSNEGTKNAMRSALGAVPDNMFRIFETGSDFYIGSLAVRAFPIPHDAREPVGFKVFSGARSVAVATDMGYLRNNVIDELSGTDMILLESNHDPQMLMNNPHYSAQLKRRILGNHGHLSNETCAAGVLRLYEEGTRHFVLGHLSGENNTPELAFDTTLNAVVRAGLAPDSDVYIHMAWRDHVGEVYTIDG